MWSVEGIERQFMSMNKRVPLLHNWLIFCNPKSVLSGQILFIDIKPTVCFPTGISIHLNDSKSYSSNSKTFHQHFPQRLLYHLPNFLRMHLSNILNFPHLEQLVHTIPLKLWKCDHKSVLLELGSLVATVSDLYQSTFTRSNTLLSFLLTAMKPVSPYSTRPGPRFFQS